MNWFDEAEMLLGEAKDFYRLHYYASVDSTNEEVKRRAREGAGEGFTAVAEEQTAGKGRRGRSWKSPAGESVYFSFLLRPEIAPEHAPALTLVMGLSAAEAVREMCGLPVRIKWPNDLVLNGKKICGILTEGMAETGCLEGVVIGTGINVNTRSFPPEIADKATSLMLEGGAEVPRGEVLAGVLRRFSGYYRSFCGTEDLSGLRDAYNGLLTGLGEEVRIEDPAGSYTAVSRGIDESGALVVERKTGAWERIRSGEVSVRGLYGYV